MSELSLAAALFGCQPAPGHAAPNQGVPTAWVLLFVKKHACEEVYAGLFTASKGTRVWVLQNAQLAWLRLYANDDHDPAAWLAELVRHRAVLAIRGSLPTIVGIFCNDSPSSRAACSVIPTVFYGHSAVILDLDLISLAQERCAAVPALLEVVAMAAPQLRGLRFTTQHIYTLPPPTLLPQLRTLYLTLSASEQQQTVHSLVRSCAAYLPQLTSLALCESEEHQPLDWPQLFNPASTSTTLRTFQCGSCLDDKLLDLLLQHTPALEQLYVDSISLRTDYSEQQWAVTLLFNEPNDSSDSQDCQGLLHLPTCSKGPTVILIGKLEFTIDTPQGISADILRRLPEWQFNIGCLEVRPADYLPAVDHPTALRNALTQLCEGLKWVEPPSRDQGRDPVADREADAWEILPKENEPVKPCLLLERWVWTPELVSELASLKPALVQRRLRGFKPRESS